MLNVYMEPRFEGADTGQGGIRRVVEALVKYLPRFDVQVVDTPDTADVIAAHGTQRPFTNDKPFVTHNHGLYWAEYDWGGDWFAKTNRDIAAAMVRAQAITVPSDWVARAVGRGLLKPTTVIYHGVDPEEWQAPKAPGNYVLWNKARADQVSNPEDMNQLARQLPDVNFVATVGTPAQNVKLIGKQTYPQMKGAIQGAGVYLATARETFGIGTLEALACGVPVVGWDIGGQSEIIVPGETGYLAQYGDYQALADMVRRCFAERGKLSRNAVADAHCRWGWLDKVEQYAALYQLVVGEWRRARPKVSVIVPCHNLARYLKDALDSIQAQTLTDWECIVVDDASDDNPKEITDRYPNVRYLRTPKNLGLSGVRNYGFSHSTGKYVTYLDADDMLTPQALEIEARALDEDQNLHIAYGRLMLVNEDKTSQKLNAFPGEFNWYGQMAHLNQISTGAMMRREVIENSSGWRTRQWRAEDAEFWARVTSLGYRAKQVTGEVTLLYRLRHDSKGAVEFRTQPDKDGNWLANIGWRSANSATEGRRYMELYGDTVPRPELVPFGAQGEPPEISWKIYHHQEPLVTVIITVPEPVDLLDALMGQSMDSWEAWVVGTELKGFPWARFVEDEAQIKQRGLLKLTINQPVRIGSDLLWEFVNQFQGEPRVQAWLKQHAAAEVQPEAGQDVWVEYYGENTARIPYKVGAKVYFGAKGTRLKVHPRDAGVLEARGKWRQLTGARPIPETAMADYVH